MASTKCWNLIHRDLGKYEQ